MIYARLLYVANKLGFVPPLSTVATSELLAASITETVWVNLLAVQTRPAIAPIPYGSVPTPISVIFAPVKASNTATKLVFRMETNNLPFESAAPFALPEFSVLKVAEIVRAFASITAI